MFITSVSYDYYKAFVTAFIEINGAEQETIFGKPPVEKVVPLVNSVALIEQIILFIFSVFVVLHCALGSAVFSLWIVWAPILAFFCVLFVVAMIMFFYYVYCSFKHVRSKYWIVAYCFILPIAFINFVLFYGMPILISILMPVQKETSRFQSPKTWDWTLYLVLWLVGALMKGFVRPSEDPLNPYSDQMPNIITSFIYFLFFFMVAAFIYMLTARTDGTIPIFNNVSFPPISFWIVFIPYYCAALMLFITFAVKGIMEWRLVIKQKDPNGDGYFKAINYSVVLLFIILMFVTGIILCVKLELPASRQRDMNLGTCIVLIPIASFLMFLLSLFPFIDYIIKVVKKKAAEAKKAASGSADTVASPTSNEGEVQAQDETKDVEMQENKPEIEEDGDDGKKKKKKKDDDDSSDSSSSDDDSDAGSAEQVQDNGTVEMLTFL